MRAGARLGAVLTPVFTPLVCSLLVAVGALLLLAPYPETDTTRRSADHVIIAGAAGLRWDDVNPVDTPTMWRLAERGAIGALSVRSARRITCPGDGWVTLGAGNFARYHTEPVQPVCPPLRVEITEAGPRSVSVPAQRGLVTDNRTLPWGARPGALAEAVRCTSAIGPGAAIAAARPYGRVDQYAPATGDGTARLLEACSLSIVDLGTIVGEGQARTDAVRQADAALAAVVAARPPRSLLVVAGLSDVDNTGRLHVAIADGPGFTGGWLGSPTTIRSGYLQLVDLAPTALVVLDRPVPAKLFAGAAAFTSQGRPPDLSEAVGTLADADREASVQRRVAGNFFLVLAFAQALLFAALTPLLRRARRPAGPVAATPPPRALVRVMEILLMAGALAVPAALVADLVPWWRWYLPGTGFAGVLLAVLAVMTAAVTVVTARTRMLGPLAVVAAVAALAVTLDVLTGARLQLNGVAGYSAVAGGRYAGVGAIGLGVLTAGLLLLGGALAQRVQRRWRPFVMVLVGAVGVVVVGSPYLGADASGAVALAAGVCAAAMTAGGGWVTVRRLAWAGVAAVGAAAGFALLDLFREPEQQGSVGRFLVHTRDGTAGALLRRMAEANVASTASSPLSVLVIAATLFIGFVLLRHWGGLRRLLGLYAAVRGALLGIVTAALVAGVVEAVGLNVLGAALATATPLVALSALRVQLHADERTVASGPRG